MHTNIRYNYYMIIINYDFTNNSIDNFILIFIARILNVMSCIEWTNEMLALKNLSAVLQDSGIVLISQNTSEFEYSKVLIWKVSSLVYVVSPKHTALFVKVCFSAFYGE